jgi:Mg2+-importing ATPase
MKHLLAASRENAEHLLVTLGTCRDGLTAREVRRRHRRFGPNRVAHEKAPSWLRLLGNNFRNPFVLVLVAISAVSYFTGDEPAVIVIGIMVAVSVLMRFLQEYRSSKAAEKLRTLVRTTATVQRRGALSEKREVPFEDLVPGDILHLSAGDMIPADVRLLESKDLFVSQSALTGESMPVEKSESPPSNGAETDEPLQRSNLCFLGTNIVSGSAVAVVVATGSRTYFGALAHDILGHRALTNFDRGVNRVTWLLIRFITVMVPLIFVINGLAKHNWHDAFLFAVAVAVGLTPEMLPMVVTANLARGAVAMARRKVIVKRLNAIQNFGAMDVLCTDKTGTLTHDRIVLERHLDVRFRDDVQVLRYAYLNSYYQTGLKNLLDRAVLEHVEVEHQLRLPHAYAKVDEVPFDFTRRRMTVVVRDGRDGHLLICKGAVEEVLAVCTQAVDAGSVVPLSEELRKQVAARMDELNADGLRVVAVAHKALPAANRAYTVDDERDLVLTGFVAFLDPPKRSRPGRPWPPWRRTASG